MSAADKWNGRELKVHALAEGKELRIKVTTWVEITGIFKSGSGTENESDTRIAYMSVVSMVDRIKISTSVPILVKDKKVCKWGFQHGIYAGLTMTGKHEMFDLADPKLLDIIDQKLQAFFEAVK